MGTLKFQVVVRWMLRIFTFFLPYIPGKGSLAFGIDGGFLVFSRLPEDLALRSGLIKAYQKVFGEYPWEEKWSEEEILDKLLRELTGNSFLVILQGNEEFPVGGFAWGRILAIRELEDHIGPALGVKPLGLEKCLAKKSKGDERILYFHEFAILRQFRKGLSSVMLLIRPGFEFGWVQGVRQTLFWSTPNSKIVPLSLYMGYEPIYKTEAGGKEIIFLLNPDFLPLLKIIQRAGERAVARWMRLISYFGK